MKIQNINGQMVDIEAIENLRDYQDKELDPYNWVHLEDGDDDGTVEISLQKYDYLVDSITTLLQRYTYAVRHVKYLKEEIEDLKALINTIHQDELERNYGAYWFKHDWVRKSFESGCVDKMDMPFTEEAMNVFISHGMNFSEIKDFAFKKYEEWKATNEEPDEERE